MFLRSPYSAKVNNTNIIYSAYMYGQVLIIRIIIVVYTLCMTFTEGRIQSKTRIIVYIVHHMTESIQ